MDPAAIGVLAVIIAVVLGIGALTAWSIITGVRHKNRRAAIAAFGWHTEPPAWERIAQLGQPPFDFGFDRTVSQAIVGTTSDGTPFQAFDYHHTMPKFDGRVAMVALSQALPPIFISTDLGGHSRIDARAEKIPIGPQWEQVLDVGAYDPEFARALLTPQLLDAVAGWATEGGRNHALDLGIDGANLVALRAPSTKQPEELRVFVDHLARVAGLIDYSQLSPYTIVPKTPNLGIRGTNWSWRASDPQLLQQFAGIGPVGRNHDPKALNVITGMHRGLAFTSFDNEWTTTHYNGNSTSQVSHHQPITSLHLPTPVPTLCITHGTQEYALRVSPVLPSRFPEFDAAFDVYCSHPEFAADLINEEMAAWLLQWRPPVLILRGTSVIGLPSGQGGDAWAGASTTVSTHTPQLVWATLDFLCAFCDLIPDAVWERIGFQWPGLQEVTPEPDGLVSS